MLKYFIPLYYTIHSRSHGFHFISYILMVILPSYMILLSDGYSVFNLEFLFLYGFSFIGMISIYEIGYIWNDAVCIKKDPNPTKRINNKEIEFLSKNIKQITFIKIVVSLLVVLFMFFFKKSLNIVGYGLSLLLLIVVYFVHNHFRNWINYITVFSLTTLNYSCSLILFSNLDCLLSNIGIVVILFSIPKCFFYIKRKLNYNSFFNEGYGFSLYYLLNTIIILLVYLKYKCSILLFILSAYMCLFRFSTSLLLTLSSLRSNRKE